MNVLISGVELYYECVNFRGVNYTLNVLISGVQLIHDESVYLTGIEVALPMNEWVWSSGACDLYYFIMKCQRQRGRAILDLLRSKLLHLPNILELGGWRIAQDRLGLKSNVFVLTCSMTLSSAQDRLGLIFFPCYAFRDGCFI